MPSRDASLPAKPADSARAIWGKLSTRGGSCLPAALAKRNGDARATA